MINQALSVNITLRTIERICDKYDIRIKESHKAILTLLIPSIIYRDGSIIILSETIHQIDKVLKKKNNKLDFVSILLGINCISHIDKYGAITIPLCVLLEKLTINREIIGCKSEHLSKKVLTNATTSLCISELLSHIGIPHCISITIINIILELFNSNIDEEYKLMINKNIGFKNKKMSQIKDILSQMQLEKIFLSTAILLIISSIGLNIRTNLILVSIINELYYVIKLEYKSRTMKGFLRR